MLMILYVQMCRKDVDGKRKSSSVTLTWASLLQGEQLQVQAVQQSEVLLSEEDDAPLHACSLSR